VFARLRREPLPDLLRRTGRRLIWRILDTRRITVRLAGRDQVRVSRVRGIGSRSYRLADPAVTHVVRTGWVRVILPDASRLVELAVSGLLTGQLRRLQVRLDSAPEWLVTGIRPPRLGRNAKRFRWRRRGDSLLVEFGWSRPYPVHRALADAVAAVLRPRSWDQTSGPVFLLHRAAWLDGGSSWPQGQVAAGPPEPEADVRGRPLGPYLDPEPPGETLPAPLVTAVANPYGRRLVGTAAPYQLVVEPAGIRLRDETGRGVLWLDREGTIGVEGAVARAGLSKYAVVSVEDRVALDGLATDALRALAACGMVFATADQDTRHSLDSLDLVTVRHPKEVEDLHGYALSVEASRRMAIASDAALRRTALRGPGSLPLPTVSIVLSSMRSAHVEECLRYLAAQTYPALEVLVGLHGYELPEETRAQWRAMLPFPARVVSLPAELPFGAVLGQLSRMAEGELITKIDDDDRYGVNHVTDLVIAWHTSGADVAAKGSRFVHFPEMDKTIDRAWAAPEQFNVTPAGGTLLLATSTLQQFGGWSHSSKHVDTDLLIRIRSAGGLVYRTHGLEYVYVRRTEGHTWQTEIEDIQSQGERIYPGLPEEILSPRHASRAGGSRPPESASSYETC
jgi:hypothetical protein